MVTSSSFELTDSHCHLDFPDFDETRDAVITRAIDAGVTRMVTICTRLRQLDQVRAIADAHPSVFFAAGTHPMHAAEEPLVSVEDLLAVAEHPKMVGIGETGLDYHYTSESRDIQIESLLIHIEFLCDALLFILRRTGAIGFGFGVLPVDVWNCDVQERSKPKGHFRRCTC